jgi:dynactin 1
VSHLQKQGTARPGTASSQSGRSEQVSPVASQDIDEQSPGSDQDVDDTDPSFKGVSGLTGRTADIRRQSRQIAASSRPATSSTSTLNREMEDLKTKLKVVENKRAEDRERLKNMEKLQSERDKFESIIQKLQAKYQPQQQEIADLRQRIKDAELKLEAAENERVEIDTAMEMATLDREMAEEQAEGYKLELESIRGKCEELELEVEILREENSEFSKEMSPEERTSQGWLHMERNNERLREALLRLRDITQDQEADLRSQIEELQTETTDLAAMRQSLEETKSKLDSSEQLASELKQQLEDAEGADDMVEELTERNMNLTERIDDLKVAVEDLESLKELNDELEQNHIEHEKQLQDDIEEREAQYIELARKSSSQDETITDLEYTISRFRELVTNLQSDLEDMRASQQITEHEATELGSRSKAMMDLNLRLQASASKSQNKAIEMELRRLEAQEAIDHLNIVQCFLPDSYAIDKDSVNAYLRIKRIGFKADLLHSFVRDRANGIAMPGREEDVFAACILMDELVWVSAMCQKFIKFIRGCSLDSFKKIEGALYDLEPVERALNGWVESLKRGDLKEPQCASELKRYVYCNRDHLALTKLNIQIHRSHVSSGWDTHTR